MQISQIMKRHGVSCTAEEFHSWVNLTFHKFESDVYDDLHQDMWQSLPRQFSLLIDDLVASPSALPNSLRVLDVGCGTGLASDSLLRTPLGARVHCIHLLDTSEAMLRRASERAKSWNRPFRCLEGLLDSVGSSEPYDVVVACSVLHHIPDLSFFLRKIRSLQMEGGIFIHLQDPNGDYLADPELSARMKRADQELSPPVSRFTPSRIFARLLRELTGRQRTDYISRTNRELVERGVIKTRLTVPELFSVTDIHVHDGQGISISDLRKGLPDYSLISQRSYAFMGRLASALPDHFREIEDRQTAAHALNGFHIGALWRCGLN